MNANQVRLKQEADNLRMLLERYSKTDSEVEDFLRRITPWFERIDRGEITPPCRDYRLSVYFTNPDLSPLAERYLGHELGRAEASFCCTILDLR